MKFPLNVTQQTYCPVCRKAGPGTNSPVTPRPETVTLTFSVQSFVHGRSYPVYMGSLLMLGWDSGISKHPQSRASIGEAIILAKKYARDPQAGQLEVVFCSTRCLRRFVKQAIDELDRRIALNRPTVRKAKSKPGRQ
ncbi:MAG TPA: hypothetical protein VG734_10460 [Lacunisphaera sp.]|nr:hypothetical protein [Lacunisphaera sp.]